MDACDAKAVEFKRNCEVRNEGGTTPYTGCFCQSMRFTQSCFDSAGCSIAARGLRLIHPECFTPPSSSDDGCGLTFDGGFSNSCDCNPDDPLCTSPTLIDVANNGYRLTDAAAGVYFDLRVTGTKIGTAWTEPDTDDAWLVLDRNGNGVIDDGSEMFGNFTPQPADENKNGFLALAEFDKSANGGNGDGMITAADSVYTRLRLWQDSNQNGISEVTELSALPFFNVTEISLDYKETKRIDRHGNLFRYRAKVNGSRSAWDVFLVHQK